MSENAQQDERPFIIWTLRRAGGTNLSRALFQLSRFSGIEHEPFNIDRIHGKIHLEWRDQKNRQHAARAIEAVLSGQPLIKHCLEIIPPVINEILAKTGTSLGYRHLFLYREFSTDRLLSLNYAQRTGVWGAKQKNEIKIDESIFEEVIDSARVLTHEGHCRGEMRRIHGILGELGAEIMCVSFEELYQNSSYEEAVTTARSVFDFLRIDSGELDDQFFADTLKGGGQGTKGEYLRFPGSEDFVSRSRMMERFNLTPHGMG